MWSRALFSATDAESKEQVSMLDVDDDDQIAALRQKGRSDGLECPVCQRPVLVKAGAILRPHFAHRKIGDCPFSNQSAELLHARQVLYQWLQGKFPGKVVVEKWVEEWELPRPIDCWVERVDKASLAYWIIEKGRNPPYRENLRDAETASNIPWNFVFLASMMRRSGDSEDTLQLSTTERNFLRRTQYEAMYQTWAEGSLHYLDPETRMFTIFRAMRQGSCVQEHSGVRLISPIERVLATSKNGQFSHPSEKEKYEEWKEEKKRQEEEEKRREAEERKWLESMKAMRRTARRKAPVAGSGLRTARKARSSAPKKEARSPEPDIRKPETKEGVCVYCGQRTRDWWTYDGKTGECKCNPCRERMKQAGSTTNA